ncbi:WGR and DUF4132 domain-containing protein [Streptomyces sp. NPDC058221]|uniref:WGR and DUF4132 domain-containing protein n=1 Tax=Streptomyces sp. NPDC058221 TaxID=3346388 RepID=UPI0036E315C6
MRRWEYVEGSASKFWETGTNGTVVTVRYGRCGSDGRTQTKDHASAEAAAAQAAKSIAEKERKGYREVGAVAAVSGTGPDPHSGESAGPSSVLLPDEDTFVLPAAWRQALHPRRGGVARKPAAAQRHHWNRLLVPTAAQKASIQGYLSAPRDAGLAEELRSHLAGSPSPSGAAALASIMRLDESAARTWPDIWSEQHGLPFAARATVELFMVGSPSELHGGKPIGPVAQALTGTGSVAWASPRRLTAHRVRELLAATDEATYRSAAEALTAHRTDAHRKIVTAYLVPSETDWVAELCTDPDVAAVRHQIMLSLVCGTLNSAEQAESFPHLPPIGHSLPVIATAAEGIGTAAVPMLAEGLSDGNHYSDGAKKTAEALVEFPTDDAFRLLLGRADSKQVRPSLLEAMHRYPVRALRLLSAEARDHAETSSVVSLQLLPGHVAAHRGQVEAVLPALDNELVAVIEPLLNPVGLTADASADALPAALTGPPESLPGGPRARKLPLWANPALLPQIDVVSGGALPQTSVLHVLSMLATSGPGRVHPGLGSLTRTADAASLAEFGWALFQQWQFALMPPEESWALRALGVLGNDDTVRRLTPVIRAWPGEGAHHRAVEGLDVLAAIGSDVALLHLHGISERVKFKALKLRATEKIAEVAAGLGLTGDQLSDRLVPGFGLNADGSTVIDYGSRTFTVGFDEQLRPYVLDGDGKRLKDLPKPGAQDHAGLAPAERKRFVALKKDVRTVASHRVHRLEDAMVAGRSWTAQEFRALFVGHSLVCHLVRRLVWLSETDEGRTAFRVAEDRTFADAEDESFALPEHATVRPAHPLHLGGQLSTWARLFADYGIMQPFQQLARPVFTPAAEDTGNRLTRFEGLKVPTAKVIGLERRGWERGAPQDAGVERWISKWLGDRWLVIALRYGVHVGDIDMTQLQTIETVWLDNRPADYRPADRGYPLRFDELDAVTLSELLADLTDLTEGVAA